DDLTGSSTLRQAEGPVLDGVSRLVRCVRLASILPMTLARPCLLKVDTQGSELDVLEGLGERLADVDVLLIEASLMAFRRGAPELADIVRYLHERSFSVYDILEGHVRSLDRALAQVDLVFVRQHSVLRRDPRFFDARQAKAYVASSSRIHRI